MKGERRSGVIKREAFNLVTFKFLDFLENNVEENPYFLLKFVVKECLPCRELGRERWKDFLL